MDFRHEWKHEISPLDLEILRMRLKAVAKPDAHAINGSYEIRSLYFDNLADKALLEKIDGISRREKFRIRYYNRMPSPIHLEKKAKLRGLGRKQAVQLSVREVQALVKHPLDWMPDSDSPLIHELYHKMRTQGLRPRTIVDYTREAFVYGPGNVRVTLDYNIRTSLGYINFLNPDCVTIPVENSPVILEVKWNAFLPSIIQDAVQLEGRRTASFSKYAACRIYG